MTTRTPRLNEVQVHRYKQEGYLIYEQPVLSPDRFDGLTKYFESLLRNLPEGERPEAMDVPHLSHPKLHEWLLCDEILDLVEPIIGPDIVLFSSHFVCKPRGDGKRVPWHEDSYYWGKRIDPMEVCTVWLAIDPSTTENGCMKVIPRTHDNGYSDYEDVDDTSINVFATEIVKTQLDNKKEVAIELKPNQACLHHGKLMHGSDANTSNQRRCGYTMRYFSASCKIHDNPENFVYFLARGKDRAGNQYADPKRAYPHIGKMKVTPKGH